MSALSAVTFSAVILCVGEAAHQADVVQTVVALAVAAVAGTLLVRQQRGQAAPLLPMDLYRRPLFAL